MSIKVTDRRMFTEEGELREGYEETDRDDEEEQERARERDSRSPGPAPSDTRPKIETPGGSPTAQSPPSQTQQQTRRPSQGSAASPSGAARPDVDTGEERHAAAQFIEIIASLVEPATLFLGDAQMPDGQDVQDLERARVYIDLLAVLQEKTRGNLTQEEESVLGEMLYRLRMRYVQKRDAKK